MTNKPNEWIKKAMRHLKQDRGGKCQKCGNGGRLEFAHIEPTDLNGRGRGRKERYYDVINNPTAYLLLCRNCHKLFDAAQKDGFFNG
jgi:5-methylcytosine-specific restriction endonuclease McrA